MKLSAVLLARALGYVELLDLSPRGTIFLPGIIPEIVRRFNFQKFPKTIEDLDESKGIEFIEGQIDDKYIGKLVLWSSLIVVETRSSTSDSKKILEETLEWGASKFGLNYRPGMIKRFAYVSDVSFYSDIPLLSVSSALTNLSDKVSRAVSEIWQEHVQYEPVNLVAGHDPLSRKYGIAPFSVARRAEARFSENKYFSEAPLPTDMHIQFLEQFEKEVAALQGHDSARAAKREAR